MKQHKRYAPQLHELHKCCNGVYHVLQLQFSSCTLPPLLAPLQFVEELKTRLAHPGMGASKSFASTGDLQRAAAANGGGGGGLGGVGGIPLQGRSRGQGT
jgi:hypothetical protein